MIQKYLQIWLHYKRNCVKYFCLRVIILFPKVAGHFFNCYTNQKAQVSKYQTKFLMKFSYYLFLSTSPLKW